MPWTSWSARLGEPDVDLGEARGLRGAADLLGEGAEGLPTPDTSVEQAVLDAIERLL